MATKSDNIVNYELVWKTGSESDPQLGQLEKRVLISEVNWLIKSPTVSLVRNSGGSILCGMQCYIVGTDTR